MTMGERLRRAREEAGLSQRQVCGDQITRNQLSQLEHDRVGPSVETLRYLAGQLGRPVSYFLDETPSNLLALQEARIRADPGEALRALEGYQPDGSAYDDLAALLESILCLAASDQAAAEGRLPYAKSLAARGREALTRCAFPAGDLVQGALLREAELADLKPGCLVIDLASKPGGVDFDAAARLGVKAFWALSLPGKVAPVTAGKSIKTTIYNILTELGV